MKIFIIFVSSLVLANALTYIPSAQRLRRDVNELQNQYLAPEVEVASTEELPLDSAAEQDSAVLTDNGYKYKTQQDSAVLTDNGYKYKTLRTLRFRKRRDVSHLNLAYLPPSPPKVKKQPLTSYLPPVEVKHQETHEPSNEYLPPVAEIKEAEIVTELPEAPSQEYLQPVTESKPKEEEFVTEAITEPTKEYLPPVAEVKEAEIVTELPQLPNNEYLPPANEIKKAEEVTELPQTPTNEYLPPISKGEDISILPLETLTKSSEEVELETEAPKESLSAEIVDANTEVPQDTAVLEADGYHYKVPESTPDLFPSLTPTTEYLPPLEEGVVEAEGPANGESSTLEEDGYHYRVIKRRF